MNTPTLGRASDVLGSRFVYSVSTCENCDAELLASEIVILSENNRTITCLFCYMSENKIVVRDFAKVLKVALGCEGCGFSKSAHALQYDHQDPKTKKRHHKTNKPIHPSDLFRYCSITDFILEVAKCVILCANCHAIKTAKERGLA